MIILKNGSNYIAGCTGDDDGNIFPVFTNKREQAMRFDNRHQFALWADELTDPINRGWFDYHIFQTIYASK